MNMFKLRKEISHLLTLILKLILNSPFTISCFQFAVDLFMNRAAGMRGINQFHFIAFAAFILLLVLISTSASSGALLAE